MQGQKSFLEYSLQQENVLVNLDIYADFSLVELCCMVLNVGCSVEKVLWNKYARLVHRILWMI